MIDLTPSVQHSQWLDTSLHPDTEGRNDREDDEYKYKMVFSKTVGIPAAQEGALWDLFLTSKETELNGGSSDTKKSPVCSTPWQSARSTIPPHPFVALVLRRKLTPVRNQRCPTSTTQRCAAARIPCRRAMVTRTILTQSAKSSGAPNQTHVRWCSWHTKVRESSAPETVRGRPADVGWVVSSSAEWL